MVDSIPSATPAPGHGPDYVPYDKRDLSYANTFTNPFKANTIRTMEWLTGKITLLRLVRRFERMGPASGQAFWKQAMGIMGIDLLTPPEQIARIPAEGPVVIVANHPHGLVDGMVLAELIGRVREDYKILTRSLLTGVKEVSRFLIPVPFPHEENAQRRNIEMRRRAMEHLDQGGVIVVFPSGVVATSETAFGPVVEAEWNPFTSKLIQRSRARVVPVFFPGRNSRAYHIADKLSPTLRQGLLIHEVVHARNKPQAPVVGEPLERDEIERWAANPRGFANWLRDHTLSLGAA